MFIFKHTYSIAFYNDIKQILHFTVIAVYTKLHWDQLLHLEWTGVWFIQVKLTYNFYIGTLFQVRFKQDSGLFQGSA